MNQYGKIAHDHWQKHVPRRFEALYDPRRFFDQLGEEIEARVEELTESMRPQLGADYLANLQQLNAVKRDAESQALQELALLPAEDDETEA
ncbi:MAG: hypothetical protein OXU20_06970 [Myxococcales bacterium]|nr:hypothetical protein [Myxococcales bacterium]MDD9965624.1 hypothetical protein [Myxococcales bacterium]